MIFGTGFIENLMKKATVFADRRLGLVILKGYSIVKIVMATVIKLFKKEQVGEVLQRLRDSGINLSLSLISG